MVPIKKSLTPDVSQGVQNPRWKGAGGNTSTTKYNREKTIKGSHEKENEFIKYFGIPTNIEELTVLPPTTLY